MRGWRSAVGGGRRKIRTKPELQFPRAFAHIELRISVCCARFPHASFPPLKAAGKKRKAGHRKQAKIAQGTGDCVEEKEKNDGVQRSTLERHALRRSCAVLLPARPFLLQPKSKREVFEPQFHIHADIVNSASQFKHTILLLPTASGFGCSVPCLTRYPDHYRPGLLGFL